MYQLFLPAPALQPYIENYWMLRSSVPAQQPVQEAIFVDGKADILFNFGVPYKRAAVDGRDTSITFSNVDGQRSYPVAILQTGAIDLIGVRFRPGGLSPFVRVPISELTNEVVEVTSLFGTAIDVLEVQLYDCRHAPSQQIALLDQFLLARLQPDEHSRLVQRIAAQFMQDSSTSVQRISDEYGYSIRSVDRFFQQTMGLSPKMYLKIVRLQNALHLLSADVDATLAEIAFRSGYYDQAHFTHDFKAFTGQTPSAYRALLLERRAEPPPNLVQFLQDARTPSA